MGTGRLILLTTAVILGMLFSNLSPSNAQTGFQRTYGGPLGDAAYCVQQTSDSGYIITGYSKADVYLIKTTPLGDTLWTRRIGGASSEVGTSVQQTSDGGYIIAGYTQSFGAGSADVYLIKTNTLGDTLWTRTYGGPSSDFGYSVQETSDSGYIITGSTQSFGSGFSDVYLIKTNSLGDTLWTRTYGGIYNDYGRSVRQTSDRGYIITGESISFGAVSYQVYLIKTDSLGVTLWTKRYGGSSDEYTFSVQQTSDTGYIITGYTESFGAGASDVYLIKTNALGDTLWTRTYGDTLRDQGLSVQQTSDGGYIIAGYTESFGAGHYDVYLIKTNSLGDTLWTRTSGGAFDDLGFFVRQTSDGGYIIAGTTLSFGSADLDAYLIKTDGNGLITGVFVGNSTRIPGEFLLKQNYPNPFNPVTTLNYQLPKQSHVTLKVHDALGREVATLVDGVQEPGYKSVTFDGSRLSSGVYYYRLQADTYVGTKKLLLIR